MLKNNKGVLTVGIVVILVLFIYSLFSNSVPMASSPASNVGEDLVNLSNSLSQVTLSRDLFSQSGYRLLTDFTLPLTPEPIGRSNPFAPLGQ